MESKKLKIVLNEYCYNCGDGCCTNFGMVTTLNGEELDCHNTDTSTIINQILEKLGYEVEIEETYNNN